MCTKTKQLQLEMPRSQCRHTMLTQTKFTVDVKKSPARLHCLCAHNYTNRKLGALLSVYPHSSLADLGGRARRTPPLWDPILSFLHTFSVKSTCIGGPRPTMGNP